MAESESTPSPPQAAAPLSVKKENVSPIGSKITEPSESRAELMTRIQGLKQDLQSWRSKLDTQVKVYREELSDLKKSLNDEVEHLRTDFQELRTTLQQQQQDVTASLRNLGLQDEAEDANEIQKGNKEVEVPAEDKENAIETHNIEALGNAEEVQVPAEVENVTNHGFMLEESKKPFSEQSRR